MNLPEDAAVEPVAAERARPSYSRSASWTFASQVAIAVLSLGNVLIVSRWLGPRGRGDVAFLTTVSYLSSQLGSLSVDQAAANIAGQAPERRRAVAGTVLALSLGLGGAAILILAALLAAFPSVGPRVSLDLRALALASIPALILSTYLTRIVFADFGVKAVNVSSVIPSVLNVAMNGTFAAAGILSVRSAFSVWVAGQLLSLLVLAWYLERRLAGFGRPSVGLAREMVSFGMKAAGGRAFQLGNYRLDQWLVGAIAGSRELGLYSVAVAWSEGLFILPRALADSQRPYLIRATRKEAGEQAAGVVRLTTLLTAPTALVAILIAPFLCETIFGSQFHASIVSLRVLALGAFGITAMKILGTALIAQNRPLLDTLATAVAFLATIGLDVALIPRHGGLGAALASTIAYSLGGVAVGVVAARTLGFGLPSLLPTLSDVRKLRRAGTQFVRRVATR